MNSLSDTIARLKAFKAGAAQPFAGADRLSDLADFGPNPGSLRARYHAPDGLAPGSAMIVVLHGCTQDAAAYDHGSGWSDLADRNGFALLYPEQSRANNPAGCFNWFMPDDIRRGRGEAMSIHQMIAAMIEAHDLDPQRIYITGLSAGAAMAMAMLATYPELFAGGAIIAGLPYGVAGSMPEALERMRGQGLPPVDELQALVRGASPHKGPWPTLSVWHGSADHVVVPASAEAIVAQWRGLQGLPYEPVVSQAVGGHSRRIWRDAIGRDVIEAWTIAGMGHGTPIDTGPEGCGAAGPFMLDVGISSTQRIAHHWGLASEPADAASRRPGEKVSESRSPRPEMPARQTPAQGYALPRATEPAASRVGRVIEDALRAAGLMR